MTLPQRCLLRTSFTACTAKRRLERPISVAPMVDISTPHFLELLHIISGREHHEYYTEMYYGQAILRHQNHLQRFLGTARNNVVVQLGGSDPIMMANAAKTIQDHGFQHVNINAGCPSTRVQHGQFGAVLMKTPEQIASMFAAMDNIGVSIPVTVKCRLGVDNLDSFDFLYRFVDTLVQSGRSLPHLIVHARKCLLKGLSPKKNRSVPPLDYERVYRLAEAFPMLPITLNGELNTVDKVRMALSKVDGCMIGRKVRDDPLFLQTLDQEIYGVPASHLKSVHTIINDYIDYAEELLLRLEQQVLDDNYGPPPLSILVKPLMSLYGGRPGRVFRHELSEQLKIHPPSKELRRVISHAQACAGISAGTQ